MTSHYLDAKRCAAEERAVKKKAAWKGRVKQVDRPAMTVRRTFNPFPYREPLPRSAPCLITPTQQNRSVAGLVNFLSGTGGDALPTARIRHCICDCLVRVVAGRWLVVELVHHRMLRKRRPSISRNQGGGQSEN